MTTKKNAPKLDILLRLIVGLPLDPAARVATQDELAALVVHEDEERERNGGQPPIEPLKYQ